MFLSFRSANVARDTSARKYFRKWIYVLSVPVMAYLRVPIRNMFVVLPISLLTQRSDDIPKGAQTPVDILGFFQPILVVPSPTLLESF